MTTPQLPSQKTADPTPAGLAEIVDANRGELIGRCLDALRKNLFTNRSQLHPRRLAELANQEVDFLIGYLRQTGGTAHEHGADLCDLGLSRQSMVGLYEVYFDFFASDWDKYSGSQALFLTLTSGMLNGFFEARDRLIRDEQKSFQTAFEIAMNRSNLETQKARQDAQEAIEASYRKVLQAQEEERRRIARELHDQAGQSLVGIHMTLENLLVNSNNEHTIRQSQLEKAITATYNVIKDIRRLAYNLRPPVLDLLGVHAALKQLCRDFSEQSGKPIRYVGVELPNIADEYSITLYRVVQEALTNTMKHANARHVWVTLVLNGNMVGLLVRDDGRGFDLATVKKGLGLVSMQERVRLLDGRISFEPAKGNTRIYVELPLVLKDAINGKSAG